MDFTKFKAFADDKLNVAEKLKVCYGKSRKHCRERRKSWLPAFFSSLTMFQKASFSRSFKVGIDWKRVKLDIVLQKVKLLWNFPIETDLLCTKIGFGGGKNDSGLNPLLLSPRSSV